MDPRLAAILDTLGLSEIRQDAKYTAALEQQLEYVKAQTYDIRYPELKARTFLPVDSSVPEGAETVSYQQWDAMGMAKILANYGDDLPLVTALTEKFSQHIEGLAAAYDYSIQDLRRSAMSGSQLETRKARMARKSIDMLFEDIAAFGHANTKMKGFLNHPNVTVAAATTDGTSTRWVGGRTTPKAPADIEKDMHDSVTYVTVATKEINRPDSLLLPTTEYAHIAQTAVGQYNDKTILQRFTTNSVSVRNVASWYKLATADAAGTGPRMVTYQRDPDVLELVIPKEFEQLPPQVKNLTFVVPCHARCGGVVVRYPLAILYTDGI